MRHATRLNSRAGRPLGRAGAFILPLLILLLGLGVRLAPLQANRFHEDEALYAYWGLQIASGADPMLNGEPVDKPPLFPYLLALTFTLCGPSEAAARLPALLAGVAGIALLGMAAQRLYGRRAALAAMFLLALNPFDIAFSTTAFTDPLMLVYVLAGLACASRGHLGRAGVCIGLSFAVKQQGVFFLPLMLWVGLLAEPLPRRPALKAIGRGLAGFLLAWAPALAWDLARTQRPGYLAQSLISYGGLGLASLAALPQRAADWLTLLGRLYGAPALTGAFFVGVAALALHALWTHRQADADRRSALDVLFAGFIALYLLVHWAFSFSIWDRYLLGLASLLALLAGRLLDLAAGTRPGRPLAMKWIPALVLMLLLSAGLLPSALQAAQGNFPAGGDHGAYAGIDRLTDFLRARVPAGGVIHQRWLGWHYRYYLYGAPQAQRWYRTPDELAAQVCEWPDVPHWVAYPEWRDRAGDLAALSSAGLRLEPRLVTTRPDGSISFRAYEIVPDADARACAALAPTARRLENP